MIHRSKVFMATIIEGLFLVVEETGLCIPRVSTQAHAASLHALRSLSGVILGSIQ